MMRLFAVRHCTSCGNRDGLISGCADFDIIDENILIKEDYLLALRECIIITSPLVRCVKTAKIIAEYTNNKNLIIQNELLIERNMGLWESSRRDIVINENKNMFLDNVFRLELAPPYGESFSDFYKRAEKFIEKLKNLLDKNNILICSHNQTLKLIYSLIKNIDMYEIWYVKKFLSGVVEEIDFAN